VLEVELEVEVIIGTVFIKVLAPTLKGIVNNFGTLFTGTLCTEDNGVLKSLLK